MKFHCRVQNNPPLVPILSQMHPVHTPSHPASLRSILTPFHLRLGLTSGFFPSGFLTTAKAVITARIPHHSFPKKRTYRPKRSQTCLSETPGKGGLDMAQFFASGRSPLDESFLAGTQQLTGVAQILQIATRVDASVGRRRGTTRRM